MIEISLFDLEEDFDNIMVQVELGQKYLVRTPDGNGIILTPCKDDSIVKAEENGWIEEFK